ncbi:unnamed protein product [Prorocentrum cordatum]|uniref:Uncharacterized protein n=1 Tax=Prorocentrum cordatum TaxID=2364126 RepID=A0ABN9VVN3_9DINO|nr:unnamed protein product [Polarella glacialis]
MLRGVPGSLAPPPAPPRWANSYLASAPVGHPPCTKRKTTARASALAAMALLSRCSTSCVVGAARGSLQRRQPPKGSTACQHSASGRRRQSGASPRPIPPSQSQAVQPSVLLPRVATSS